MHIIHVMDGWLDGGKDGMGGDGRNAIDAMDDHGCRHAGMYLYDCTWLHMVMARISRIYFTDVHSSFTI